MTSPFDAGGCAALLAIATSTEWCSVALLHGGGADGQACDSGAEEPGGGSGVEVQAGTG